MNENEWVNNWISLNESVNINEWVDENHWMRKWFQHECMSAESQHISERMANDQWVNDKEWLT